jgi:protein-S-isoprenylcysteine O-methyltransferase Ste14
MVDENKHTASLEQRSRRLTLSLLFVQGAALFLVSGSLAYWQAWLYLACFIGSSTATNAYLARHDRALLERRLAVDERGEQQPVHKIFMVVLRVLMLALLVVPALDHRFGWLHVPLVVQLLGFVLLLSGQLLVFFVLRENSYASSVIEVASEQRVISSGPYRLMRHPMYTGFLAVGFAAPLCLGSYYGELVMVPICILFTVRLLAEERFLATELPGYADYLARTRFRLVPYLW